IRRRSATGVLATALLLAVLGLILVQMEQGRSSGQHTLSTVKTPPPERPTPRSVPPLPLNDPGRRIVTRTVVPPRTRGEERPPFPFPVNEGVSSGIGGSRHRRAHPSPPSQSASVDDLVYVNRDPKEAVPQWVKLRPDEWGKIEARVRRDVQVRDDFVTIPFPRLASISNQQ